MVFPAMSLGAKEVGRWQYLNEAFDSELSLGLIAAMSALTLAVTSVVIGRVIDRTDPRPRISSGIQRRCLRNSHHDRAQNGVHWRGAVVLRLTPTLTPTAPETP